MAALQSAQRIRAAAVAAAPFLAIFAVLAPYLWPLDHGPTSLLSDIRSFQAPNVQFLASSLRDDGELPRWNPQDFAGTPLIGDPQAGVYNPVNWLLALRPTLNSFGWLIVASACAGALGFMRLAREFGCSGAGAAAGATAFVLGGKALLHLVELGHTVMAPIFLVPWLLLCFERCARRPSAMRIVAAALVLALMIIWMHPQLLVYTAAFLSACAVLAVWRSPSPPRALVAFALVAVWTAALAAVHLLPMLSLVGEFARAIPELQVPAPPGPAAAWLDVITGTAAEPEARYTFGGVTLLLAFTGLLGWARRDPRRITAWFHGGAALAILVYGLGGLPDAVMAQEIFRHPARALIVLAAPTAILVAFGVDALLRAPTRRRRTATGLAAAAAFGCLVAAGASFIQFAALAVAGAGVLVLGESGDGAKPRDTRSLLPFAAVLVVIAALGFDTGAAIEPSVRTAPQIEIGRRPSRLELPPDLEKDSRIAEPLREIVMLGIPALEKRRLGLESLTGYNSLIPWRFLVYTAYASGYDPTGYNVSVTTVPVRRMRHRLFDLLGVTHFLYAPRRASGPWTWSRAETALPRAYLVPGPVVAPEARGGERLSAELGALEQVEALNPRQHVVLHGQVAADALAAIGAAAGVPFEPFRAISVRERRPNRISIELETERRAILVLNEPFFPGWRARDAGAEIPVLRANGLFRALALRPGPHRIELEFSPTSWRVGRWVSRFAVVASAIVFLRGFRRPKTR